MALSFPSLPKLSGRTVAVLAAAGALAVGAVAAGASKDQPAASPSMDAPAAAPPQAAPAADTNSARTAAAAAALPQCRSAMLVPVNRSWGIPMPSVYGSASTYCNLMYGDDPHRGSTVFGDPDTAIRILQRNLNFCYGTKLAVDGVYGSNTRAVVKTVQRRHKLVADGIYGPKTRSAMNWRLYSMATRSWSKGCSSPL
ncbi:putative peptidoglycan binding protein [Kribbella steppae]|uniref:Putative peptidoglycan binding protein n=1 Tax=Kribbella steppae TaxID=2512223 RepID=A0A4R2H6Z7_9ACTN|nr:peptidoglycan-binding domain-containing protein [Kribbella steppae]TCO22029.1 putative peptidoglycan binding protein [Kribbella steppae]